MSMWTARHYEAVAQEIREQFPMDTPFTGATHSKENTIRRRLLLTLALSLAARFQEDNKWFDPIKFLKACTPDPDVYPIDEYWEGSVKHNA